MESKSLVICTDAASRRNPGPAAIAYRIFDSSGKEITQNKKFLGKETNNAAEYRAVIAALGAASKISNGKIQIFTDSKLLVGHMKKTNKLKAKNLKPLFQEVKEKEKLFEEVIFEYLPREDSRISSVDRMANEALDTAERAGKY